MVTTTTCFTKYENKVSYNYNEEKKRKVMTTGGKKFPDKCKYDVISHVKSMAFLLISSGAEGSYCSAVERVMLG